MVGDHWDRWFEASGVTVSCPRDGVLVEHLFMALVVHSVPWGSTTPLASFHWLDESGKELRRPTRGGGLVRAGGDWGSLRGRIVRFRTHLGEKSLILANSPESQGAVGYCFSGMANRTARMRSITAQKRVRLPPRSRSRFAMERLVDCNRGDSEFNGK